MATIAITLAESPIVVASKKKAEEVKKRPPLDPFPYKYEGGTAYPEPPPVEIKYEGGTAPARSVKPQSGGV